MNLIEMLLVAASVELQERVIHYDNMMELTDRVISMAGLGPKDWETS